MITHTSKDKSKSEKIKSTELKSVNITTSVILSTSESNSKKRQGYYKKMYRMIKKERMKFFYRNKMDTIIEYTYILISALLSLASVIVYAMQVNQKPISSFKILMFYINFGLAHFFILEFLIRLIKARNKLTFFISLQPWVDLTTLISPYMALFVVGYNFSLAFLRILRIMNLFGLFVLTKRLKSDYDNKEATEIPSKRGDRIKKRLIGLLFNVISVIFVLAGVVQQISSFYPKSFKLKYLTYIDSLYFMIVTVSTVGYGDIYPTKIATRFLIVIIISMFVYFISDQIAGIANLMARTKDNQVFFNFKDHIIIFGEILNDNINQIHLMNFFNELYSNYNNLDVEILPVCIVMLIKKDEKSLMPRLQKFPLFNRKVFLFAVDKFDFSSFSAASFERSKAIFCFNNMTESNYMSSDKILLFYIRNLVNILECRNSPQTHKPRLFVQFMYREHNLYLSHILSRRLSVDLILPRMRLKYSMISKNIFVAGWTTFITNLFRKDSALTLIHSLSRDYYFKHYLQGMNQNLSTFKFPDFVHGMRFHSVMSLFYSSSISYIAKLKEDTGFTREYSIEEKSNLSEILTIGVLRAHSDQSKIGVESITYNQSDHVINEFDYGIYIKSSYLYLDDFFSFLKGEICHQKDKSRDYFSIKRTNCTHTEKSLGRFFISEFRKNKINKNEVLVTNRFINCALQERYSFSDHILILGWNSYMEVLVTEIRMMALHNTIVILSNDVQKDEFLLKKFPNLYIVKGNYLDLKVLCNVNTEKAYYAVIITSKSDVNPNREDTNSVLVARMIEQYFNVNFLIEIRQNSNINLLGLVPSFQPANLTREDIYPNFMRGNILFNEIFDKMNARALYSNLEVLSLKELILIDVRQNSKFISVKEKLKRKIIENENYEEKIFRESSIRVFTFTLDSSYSDRSYGYLLVQLMNMCMIPLAVYNPNKAVDDTFHQSEFCDSATQDKLRRYSKILSSSLNQRVLEHCDPNHICTPFLITNPSHEMKLKSGMKIIVLGKYLKLQGENRSKNYTR